MSKKKKHTITLQVAWPRWHKVVENDPLLMEAVHMAQADIIDTACTVLEHPDFDPQADLVLQQRSPAIQKLSRRLSHNLCDLSLIARNYMERHGDNGRPYRESEIKQIASILLSKSTKALQSAADVATKALDLPNDPHVPLQREPSAIIESARIHHQLLNAQSLPCMTN